MTARPLTVGDFVRVTATIVGLPWRGTLGQVIGLDADRPTLARVAFDHVTTWFPIDGLEHQTSSEAMTEDPAEIASPHATSATPDPADPDADPAPEAGAAAAIAAPAKVTYADPALTTCNGCPTCIRREAASRRRAERDPQLVAEASRRDGGRCRYCDRLVDAPHEGRVRASAYGVMLMCKHCQSLGMDRKHAPLPAAHDSLAYGDVAHVEDQAAVNGHDEQQVPLGGSRRPVAGDLVVLGRRRPHCAPSDGQPTESAVADEESPRRVIGRADDEHHLASGALGALEREDGDLMADSQRVVELRHSSSPSGSAVAGATAQRAEASEPPQRDTDTVGDGSAADTVLPTVGGRAVPPAPAPADTTGATSVHGAAPVTDLTTLRAATRHLANVRAQLDALLTTERVLAETVSVGLATVVGIDVDLNWGATTDVLDVAALADGAR
ncbi:hypothetical protein [Sanguibacter sp. HDW7]|uniref:hypothetical protein n=1 Tax=Sanguibacter sp. HDW7 TaxID=2714931 RepID=UPI001409C3E1|nr:hypothetical protein [Sanguibacter sp. HDW7]QIK83082.1 hypothetical protein G7063_05165 [Sanguibacter sp. HDW7]